MENECNLTHPFCVLSSTFSLLYGDCCRGLRHGRAEFMNLSDGSISYLEIFFLIISWLAFSDFWLEIFVVLPKVSRCPFCARKSQTFVIGIPSSLTVCSSIPTHFIPTKRCFAATELLFIRHSQSAKANRCKITAKYWKGEWMLSAVVIMSLLLSFVISQLKKRKIKVCECEQIKCDTCVCSVPDDLINNSSQIIVRLRSRVMSSNLIQFTHKKDTHLLEE